MPGAGFYRIAWVSSDDIAAEQSQGRDGWDAVKIASIENRGQTDYTVKNLNAGALYWFRVGSGNERFGATEWSGWASLTVGVSGACAADRETLVALYDAMNGDDWQSDSRWNSDSHPEDWYGVTTDRDGCVTRLRLGNNRLSGSIPAGLSNLANLERLELNDNQLSGAIPSELGNLSNLERLYLHDNQLDGTIPAELGSLSKLERLNLWDNQLTGAIPSELGRLSALTSLFLSDNRLTGSIPAKLGNLDNLADLSLRNNQLTGCIPAALTGVPDNDLHRLGLEFCQ